MSRVFYFAMKMYVVNLLDTFLYVLKAFYKFKEEYPWLNNIVNILQSERLLNLINLNTRAMIVFLIL